MSYKRQACGTELAVARDMNPSLSLQHKQAQQQTLSPRLQHAVRLLQLSSLEFGQEIKTLQGRNPFLDFDGEAGFESDERGEPAAASSQEAESSSFDEDREAWLGDANRLVRQHEVGTASALDYLPTATSLAQHLHFQLSLMRLLPRELALAHAIVDSLDDDGYLRTPLEELLPPQSPELPVDPSELLEALQLVQTLDPQGVGARDLQECLTLQLPAIDCPLERALAAHIVEHELEAMARHQWAALARKLGCTAEQLDVVCRRIRQLDPRPGWRHGAAQTRYITPDVLVRKQRGRWTATLNSSVVPRVSLNKTYAELLTQHGGGTGTELAHHLQEARWTLRNIEQRFSTIASVAQAIVDRQKHFFDYGPMAMKPLGLREIAEELDMHESTVSRVTSNKYMATPAGVFELKHFFSRAHVSRNGNACSPTAIRGLVLRILESEPAGTALSDAEIARRLGMQGLDVARRTVTKYRQMLRIESCDLRRKAH